MSWFLRPFLASLFFLAHHAEQDCNIFPFTSHYSEPDRIGEPI